MKIVFLGATRFSAEIIEYLLLKRTRIACIFAIPEKFRISYSGKKVKNFNYADLSGIAKRYKIRFYPVDSATGKRISDYSDVIKNIRPDVIIAAGWYYMVPKKIRDLAKYGAWGIHASLLPRYAGGAPLVWAIINGEKRTGVTLFQLDDGVDDGDIISQKHFSIGFKDTIKEVYEKAAVISKNILVKALKNVSRLKPKPQDRKNIKIYPQRTPEDGRIDLNRTALEIYNFIRAQSFPYPGAFITAGDGKKVIIEKAGLVKRAVRT